MSFEHNEDEISHGHQEGDLVGNGGRANKKKLKNQKGGAGVQRGPLPGMHLPEAVGSRHPSIDAPVWLRSDLDTLTRPDDHVLGLIVANEAYALPWWIMKNHHLANLNFGGEPFLICLCEACSTGTAFNPVVNGRRLHFDLFGYYNGSFVIRDRETETIWAPFLGEALHGDLVSEMLVPLPMIQCLWREWCELHAGSFVLSGEGEPRGGHGAGHYPGSFEDNVFYRSALTYDERLPPNEMVLGVNIASDSIALPLVTLAKDGSVHNDEVGVEPVVVFCRANSLIAIAFSRMVNGRVLNFSGDGSRITDNETGSEWDIWGRAVSGRLAGSQLTFVQSYIEEWYAWFTTHPQTGLWEKHKPG